MTKKVVLIVLGVLLLVIGALAAIGGGALMALFGSNDTLVRVRSDVKAVPCSSSPSSVPSRAAVACK